MFPRSARFLMLVLCLAGSAQAGEIIILEPAVPTGSNRNEQRLQQLREGARQYVDPAGDGTVYYILEQGDVPDSSRNAEQAERLRQGARGQATYDENGQPVLRAVPLSDAEKARLRARSYTTEPVKTGSRKCGEASNQVGMIGEGSGAQQSDNVVERGGGVVTPNCR